MIIEQKRRQHWKGSEDDAMHFQASFYSEAWVGGERKGQLFEGQTSRERRGLSVPRKWVSAFPPCSDISTEMDWN
jgi:hypothetical protein